MTTGADLTHVDTWIFDLDNTLYPPEREILQAVNDKMTAFTMRVTGLGWDEALALQLGYYKERGATLTGLMEDYGVDPAEFLDAAHDVMLDHVEPDLPLERALGRLPGRRLVYTNGSAKHAERVLGALGIAHRFDEVFHIEAAELVPKPRPEAFDRLMRAHDVRPRTSAFFEDLERNLEPAHHLGMTTVLVGAFPEPRAPYVDHVAPELVPFLETALVRMAA